MLESSEYWATIAQLSSSIVAQELTYEQLWEHMFVKGTPYQYLVLHHSHNDGAIAESTESIATNPPGGWYESLKGLCYHAVVADIKDMIRRQGIDPDSF